MDNILEGTETLKCGQFLPKKQAEFPEKIEDLFAVSGTAALLLESPEKWLDRKKYSYISDGWTLAMYLARRIGWEGERFWERFQKARAELVGETFGPEPDDELRDLLLKLREKGIYLVLCSNAKKSGGEALLKHLHLSEFEIVSYVKGADENFTVLYSVCDAEGNEVASACRPADETAVKVYVPDATLWEIDAPYLYTVTARLQRRNESYDEISARVGVRSFSCDPNKGFILNGTETPLRGVSRHQDMLYKGNALTKEDHYEDARMIKELGANTIRLAHYQHSQDFYDACDEMGFVVWAEIPFISVMNQDPDAHQNCISQLKELIIQNYNHPSICFWGISNEILIGGISEKLVENHKELNALAKELDPSRLTTIAHVCHALQSGKPLPSAYSYDSTISCVGVPNPPVMELPSSALSPPGTIYPSKS